MLSDADLIGGMDVKLNEGKYNDLIDGRYEKTIYVKTWTGRTVSLVTDLNHAVGTVKRQLEAKTGIPKDHQHLASRGKVSEGQQNAEGLLHIWRRDYRNDSTAIRRNETQKPQPQANGHRKRQKKKRI